ncbi:hypothetical protein [Polaromonas sp.]|uniref:hypothetical protein n=1 Tax=Polaromonas sp. TaxID=1869339 RepID=UPI003BA998F9
MKRFPILFFRFLAGLGLAVATGTGIASEGHDHGEGAAAAAETASPRISAHSDLFELLGIVSKGQMVVYLDRYTSNEPVTGARIEFETGDAKGIAAPQADGTYLLKLGTLGKPGDTAFSFTVTAGTDTDLLAGELSITDAHDSHGEAGSRPWLRLMAWAMAAVALILGAAVLVRRFRARRAFN